MSEYRIYAASLADYNNGILHGTWIDIEPGFTDKDDILEAISEMLNESPAQKKYGNIAEEWAIHDYDGIPSSFGEWPDLEKLCWYVEQFDEHGEPWKVYCEENGLNYATEDDFNNRFMGIYQDEEDYARQYVEDSGLLDGVPDTVSNYFDYESFAEDLFMDSVTSFRLEDGTVAVFSRC